MARPRPARAKRTRTPPGLRKLTETDYPEAGEDRHPRYLDNMHEAAHYWSANRRREGQAGNVFFRNGTAYSYGEHFPVARHAVVRKTGKKAIFFTTRGYSASTSKHIGAVRSAVPRGTAVVEVFDPTADTADAHRKNFERLRDDALYRLSEAAKPRLRQHTRDRHRSDALRLVRRANAYAELVGLKDRIQAVESEDLEAWGRKVLESAEKANAAELARQEKAIAKAVWKWETKLAAWQAGAEEKPGTCPKYTDPRNGLAYVRVSRDKYLQTTLGMSVPLGDVLPALADIRRCSALGEVLGVAATGYKILDWDGRADYAGRVFVVGCHRIAFDEIERAAKAAGL